MKRINQKVSKSLALAIGCLPALALVGCSAAPDGDGSVSSAEQQGTDENLANPGLAAAVAEAKIAMMGGASSIDKHAACGTPGPTGTSTHHNDAPSQGAANQRSGS